MKTIRVWTQLPYAHSPVELDYEISCAAIHSQDAAVLANANDHEKTGWKE